jgi:hypothetical protein
MIISDSILICRNAVEVEEEVCIGRRIADEGNLDKKKWKRKVLATVGFSNRRHDNSFDTVWAYRFKHAKTVGLSSG